MNCEPSFVFGKTASTINEAYTKMYVPQNLRTVNEAEDDDFNPDDVEEIDAAELGGDFDADKEYRNISDIERKGKEMAELEVGSDREDLPDTGTKLDAKASTDDDEEDADNKVMPFSRLSRGSEKDRGSEPEFYFSTHHGKRKRYPEYLRAAAKAKGYKLPDEDEPIISDKPSKHVRNSSTSVVRDNRTDGEDGGDSGTPEDNFYENVILANPNEFNDELYDMECLDAHHKEIYDGWRNKSKTIIDIIQATKAALEEIPGCESREVVAQQSSNDADDSDGNDAVGNIDNETSTVGKYGIVIKMLDPTINYRTAPTIAAYVTKTFGLDDKEFDSVEEAADAIRNALSDMTDDPRYVYIGSVIDVDKARRLLSGNTYEYAVDDGTGKKVTISSDSAALMNGAAKKVRINPTVYTISSSNDAYTSNMLRRENRYVKKPVLTCDEYLVEDDE